MNTSLLLDNSALRTLCVWGRGLSGVVAGDAREAGQRRVWSGTRCAAPVWVEAAP